MYNTDEQQWSPGPRNLITDVQGLLVGHAQDKQRKTGVTVLSAQQPFAAAVDVMGGAPGTRETDCLASDRLVQAVDALVLAGGSAFGLDAASGVVDALHEINRGFAVGPFRVPIVPAAIIFDLISGGQAYSSPNPYRSLGRQAFKALHDDFALGTAGAGTGATTAHLKGGVGSASLCLPDGATVGALVVANPHGHATIPDSQYFWAAPFEMNSEFGGLGLPGSFQPHVIPQNRKFTAFAKKYGDGEAAAPGRETGSPAHPGANTTIAVVATDAALDKPQLKRLAVAAQDGIARAVVPSHTLHDGDLVFAVSTGTRDLPDPLADPLLLGHAASVCLARAIARAIFHAHSESDDTLPCWQDLYGPETDA